MTFNNEIEQRVKEFLAAGKAVIAAGSSGLNHEGSRFALEKGIRAFLNR